MSVYFECRENKVYPAPGGPQAQTAFCIEVFEFLDGIVAERNRKAMEQAKKDAQPKK